MLSRVQTFIQIDRPKCTWYFLDMKKRIVVEVNERFHTDIKKRAALKGVTMKVYVLDALIQHIKGTYESGVIQHNAYDKLPE